MGSSRERRLLTYGEAAAMLSLSVLEVEWFVNTGQLREVTTRGKKRLDQRDVDRLVSFYKKVQQRSKNHVQPYSNVQER